MKKTNSIRFSKIAYFARLFANVLKHTGGIVAENSNSVKKLMDEFKIKNGLDLVACRSFIKINKIPIGNIFFIISRIYVFMIDLAALIFGFKRFRIKRTDYQFIQDHIVNYDVRGEYEEFLKSVQQDESVMFMNLP